MNTEHTNQPRAQFEAWASEHCCAAGGISFKRFYDDGASSIYNDPNVETAWQAWQAALQQPVVPVGYVAPEELPGLEDGVCAFLYPRRDGYATQAMYAQPPAVAGAVAVAVPDEVAKDAARYRWLRQDESVFSSMTPAELDAAIDKAIAAAQKGGA